MKIAQIAPLHESVPPKLYGGTERVVSYLTEELVRQGHDVTLFASGDSKTSAKLVRCCDMALRLNPCPGPFTLSRHHAGGGAAEDRPVRRPAFSHRFPACSASSRLRRPYLDNSSRPIGLPGFRPVLSRCFRSSPRLGLKRSAQVFASCELGRHCSSWSSARPPSVPAEHVGGYLAFLGRISPEKGPIARSRSPREPECR